MNTKTRRSLALFAATALTTGSLIACAPQASTNTGSQKAESSETSQSSEMSIPKQTEEKPSESTSPTTSSSASTSQTQHRDRAKTVGHHGLALGRMSRRLELFDPRRHLRHAFRRNAHHRRQHGIHRNRVFESLQGQQHMDLGTHYPFHKRKHQMGGTRGPSGTDGTGFRQGPRNDQLAQWPGTPHSGGGRRGENHLHVQLVH